MHTGMLIYTSAHIHTFVVGGAVVGGIQDKNPGVRDGPLN